MHTLTEHVDIDAPFERLCDWADNFEEEFVRWSPYHLECELYDGGVTVGSKVRFREIVMGLDYDVTGTITQSVRDRDHFRFVFRSDRKTALITFEGERTATGCRFSHTESFGIGTPVIGPVINFLVFRVFFRKKANWRLIRDDMILDNRYLKEILEKGRYPERISPDELRGEGNMSDTRASHHVKLQGVADTTYIPMVARIYATERFPEYFRDATALELRDRIPTEALERIRKRSSEYTMLASVARYHVLDELVRAFAARHPGGCNVINLGAGLETMAQRLSLPAVTFYEIDLPKTVELRNSLIDPPSSEVIIAGDMFELDWTERVNREVPSLLIASGVFQYFREERITRFLRELAERLPGSELVFDATNEVGVRYANRYVRRTGNASAQIRFYVNDARAFAGKLGMPLVEERVFYTEARRVLKGRLRLWTRIAMRVCDDKRRAILVHLRLQGQSPAQASGAARLAGP